MYVAYTVALEWNKGFNEGRVGIEDNEHPRHQRLTDDNNGKINRIIRSGRRVRIGSIASVRTVEKKTVRHILWGQLKMERACASGNPQQVGE